MRHDEKGSTMLEVIMVFGIIAVLSVGVIMLVNKVMDRYKVSVAGTQIQTLRKNISNRYLATGSYKDVTMSNVDDLFADGVIPKNMYSNGKLYHAFGGTVQISGTNNGKFNVSFVNLSKKACVELAMLNWKVDDTSFLDSLNIGAIDYTWVPSGITSHILPIKIEEADDLCGDGSTITWTFL